LTANFDEAVNVSKQTAEEQKAIDDKDEVRRKKARESRKKYRDKKKSEKSAISSKPEELEELRGLVKECKEIPMPPIEENGAVIDVKITKVVDDLDKSLDDEVGEESTNLLDNVDLSAFINK
jgi:hypothetical protein